MANKHVSLPKSAQLVEGKPKLPEASRLVYGELAVNYKKGHETISLKTDANDIVGFNLGDFAVKTKVGDADPVTVSDLRQSTADGVTLIQGNNVTLTPDATNGTITIAGTPNSHYTAKNIVTNTSTGKEVAAATTNGDVYINLVENNTVRTSTNIVGDGATTVTSDENGKITVYSPASGTPNDGKLTFKTKVGSAEAVTVTEFTANQSSNDSLTFIQGNNVALTTDTTNNTITIGATDTDRYVNSAAFADDTTESSASPVKMTLTRAGSDSATVTGNIPKVSKDSAGVAPKGAEVTSQSQSTKFLREDGSWSAPTYTVNTDTSVTSAANHYAPTKDSSATKTASGATGTPGATVQVVTGIETDGKGHVTGVVSGAATDTNTTYKLSVNGTTNGDSANGTDLGAIYAPTVAGTTGQFLKSAGSGAPSWETVTIPAAANDAKFNIKTKVGTAAAVTVADFTANQSGNDDDVTFIQGDNVTLTTDTTNRTVTIAATDTTYSAGTKTILDTGTDTTNRVWPAKEIADYVAGMIGNATVFRDGFDASSADGTLDGTGTLKSVAEKVGYMYTVTTAGTFLTVPLEVGDSIIFKKAVAAGTAPKANDLIFVEGTVSVSDNNPTLEWGTQSKVGTVEGVDLHVSLPANPNTDTTYKLSVNGSTNGDSTSGTDLGTIYAPTGAGSSGQFLKSSGSGAPTWQSVTIPAAANNGTFSVKTKVGTAAAVTAADFTADQSSADDVTFIQGDNVTLTTDTTNRTVTIASANTTYKTTVNGTGNGDTTNGTDLGTVYAPTTAGTARQVALSSGSGAPTWNTGEIIRPILTTSGTAAVTTSPYNFSKWDATSPEITSYYDGLMILYKVPVAGNGTYGTCLQINSLGYHPVVMNVNGMVSTSFAVNEEILLSYDGSQSGTVYNNSDSSSTITGVWRAVNHKNTTYSAGTDAQLTAGTTTSNRVWSAKILHDYIAKPSSLPAVSATSAGIAPQGAAVSSQSQSTKFLREDGTWAAPSYTTNTNTTYKLSVNGSTNGDSTSGTDLGTIYAPTGAGTSGQYLKSNGSGAPSWTNFPTIPTISLNGSSSTSPSFYAPTGAGTSGQYLKSNGSGAPSWTNFPTIPTISLNGSASTSPSFYAPTTAGTSGYYLKSSGSGAPTWSSFPTIPSITLNGSASTSPSFYAPTSVGSAGQFLTSSGSGAPSWGNTNVSMGAGTATSLNGLSVTNRLIVCSITANQSTVSITNGVSALKAGMELHVIVKNNATAHTITLPTSSPYVNCGSDSSLSVAASGKAEINFISDGTSIYVRGVA